MFQQLILLINFPMQRYFALLGLFCLPFLALAFTVPEKPNTYVNDYAKILTVEETTALETKIESFERNTTNEIAVVTIESLEGDTVENVAQQIFTKWGIGKKDKNNGVLLLVAVSDRKTRIHTGYGVEGDLTDIGTSYIQRDIMTPAFRNEDYYGGINGAVDKMIEALGGSNIVPEGYSEEKSGLRWDYIFILGFIFLQWLVAILAKSKSWWAGGVVGAVIGVILMFVFTLTIGIIALVVLTPLGLLFDYLVSKAYKDAKSGGKTPPWFFGGGGFGGGSHGGGGFGGFGGGMSGGGGSSGRW